VLVLVHFSIALALQWTVMPLREYTGGAPHFLLRWLTMAALAGPLIFLPAAALLGSYSVPPASHFEATQSLLLTRLTPFGICAGRLLAQLWPLISGIFASCAVALAVQVIWRPLMPGSPAGYAAILTERLVLLTAVLATGAVGFLAAQRRRPGRNWGRGAGIALAASGLAIGGLLMANPLIRRMDNPTGVIYGALLVNPATAATTALGADILRMGWIYERTDAPEYPFSYPPPLASCAVFAAVAGGAMAAASMRLRRAYR
jgi:hypothetical protein